MSILLQAVQKKPMFMKREQPVCSYCGSAALPGDGLIHGPEECYWTSYEAFSSWMDLHEPESAAPWLECLFEKKHAEG